MRTMKPLEGNSSLRIVEHLILKNFWEYYITDEETDDPDIKFAYVMGFENELGYVSMNELRPYIITRTKDLSEIMPASGYKWVEV